MSETHGATPPGAWPTGSFVSPDPRRRWARALRAAADAALTTGDLHRAVRRRGEASAGSVREKLKTLRTLRTLTRHGLLAHTPAGLITTHLGLSALAAAEALANAGGDLAEGDA